MERKSRHIPAEWSRPAGRRFLLLCLCAAFLLGFAFPAQARPLLFGTVEFQMPLDKQKNWLSVISENKKSPVLYNETKLNRSTTWKQLKQSAEGKPVMEKLRLVNRFWNTWPYRTDPEVYGKPDVWAAPVKFLKTSGDCEDYSIAKYFTLKELGVPVEDMRIVVVRETVRNIGHAVLAVYVGEEIFILDNLSDSVRSTARIRNYVPQFSVNEEHRWVHVQGKKKNAKKTAKKAVKK